MKVMEFFPDAKTLLSIGSLHVTWYAVLFLGGAFLAYGLSLRQLKKWGYKEELIENFFSFDDVSDCDYRSTLVLCYF